MMRGVQPSGATDRLDEGRKCDSRDDVAQYVERATLYTWTRMIHLLCTGCELVSGGS